MSGPAAPASPLRQLRGSILAITFVTLAGTFGYMQLESLGFLDALYYTVITLATVGFSEPHGEFTAEGKAFTIVLVLAGLGIFSLLVGNVARIFVSGEIRRALGEYRMDRRLRSLDEHFIICGYGRLGRAIAAAFRAQKTAFVVIEPDEAAHRQAIDDGALALRGDASNDDTLVEAGLRVARGLITVCADDAINVFITLTARQLRPDLHILARASNEMGEKKLRRAGASRTFSPFAFGGNYMAQAALRPNVVDFFDMTSLPTAASIFIEEIQVPDKSPVSHQSLRELALSQRFGVIVVAIRHRGASGRLEFNPSARSVVEGGDLLITLGEAGNLRDTAEYLKTGAVHRTATGATQSILIPTLDAGKETGEGPAPGAKS